MAFRATKKPVKKSVTVKSTHTQDTPVYQASDSPLETPAQTPSISIDDLVGGPQKQAHITSSFPIVEQTPDDIAIEHPLPPEPPSQEQGTVPIPQSQQMQQDSYGGGHRSGGYRRYSGHGGGGGYRDRNMSGGGGYGRRDRFGGDRRGGYGYRDRNMNSGGGYQRRYDDGGQQFTQDIDVPTETVRGILDIMPEGHGFLRPKFTPSERDVYISQSQIRRFLLRNGDMVQGQARQPKENERYWGLLKVELMNEQPVEAMGARPRFEDLTPIYPNVQLKIETGDKPLSTRMIDLLAPIGFGQRGLIVSPPKAGKTTMLKELASGITENFPHVHLMAALIGERPEEVTDLSRNIKGEVLASNFDQSPQEQTRVAEVALDRAKRLVEMGYDVVVLLDSITRLARAYNLVVNPSGRTLSGGFDPAALYPAKKFLGAARCVEQHIPPLANTQNTQNADGTVAPVVPLIPVQRYTTGGSLTVIGTALVDTGSRMDDLIYEEFKGTGNMELHLSRQLQERRIFPAIDVEKSGTRHDELLLGDENMKRVTTLRHMLSLLSNEERTAMLIERLGKTKSNAEFLQSLSQGGV